MQQQEFSEWLCTMQQQQQQTTTTSAASHASDSSSWTDTDSESDSESEQLSGHLAYFNQQHKSGERKQQKMVPSFERTAPMMIPQTSRHRRRSSAFYMNEFEDSAPSHTTAASTFGLCGSAYAESAAEDEDDPALYQNLAYFRSQNSRKAMLSSHHQQQQSVRSRSPSPVSTASESDDIFDMEL